MSQRCYGCQPANPVPDVLCWCRSCRASGGLNHMHTCLGMQLCFKCQSERLCSLHNRDTDQFHPSPKEGK